MDQKCDGWLPVMFSIDTDVYVPMLFISRFFSHSFGTNTIKKGAECSGNLSKWWNHRVSSTAFLKYTNVCVQCLDTILTDIMFVHTQVWEYLARASLMLMLQVHFHSLISLTVWGLMCDFVPFSIHVWSWLERHTHL